MKLRYGIPLCVLASVGCNESRELADSQSLRSQSSATKRATHASTSDTVLVHTALTPLQLVALETITRTFKKWRLPEPQELSRASVHDANGGISGRSLAIQGGEDAVKDFAIALSRGDSVKVVYFHHSGDRYLPGIDLATATWLADGRLFFVGDTLNVGPQNSDELFRFRWSDKARRPVLMPADRP